MEIKKTLESDAVNHSNSFCNPAHNGEHQQQAAAAGAATAVWQHTTQQRVGISEYILVRPAAPYSITIIIYQVEVLCCETTYGVYVVKKEKQ